MLYHNLSICIYVAIYVLYENIETLGSGSL